ncbi:UPF0594 protein, partial [Operophtera brumata]
MQSTTTYTYIAISMKDSRGFPAELKMKDSAAWQNGEIEKQIYNLQEDLQQSDYSWDHDDDLQRESGKHKILLENIDKEWRLDSESKVNEQKHGLQWRIYRHLLIILTTS